MWRPTVDDRTLTAKDPEPGLGAVVTDATGADWIHTLSNNGGGYWLRWPDLDGDPESWVKVAGNYGPVTLEGSGHDL